MHISEKLLICACTTLIFFPFGFCLMFLTDLRALWNNTHDLLCYPSLFVFTRAWFLMK